MNYEKEVARPGNGRSRYADGEREKNKIGKFSKQDIRELCLSLSISSIEGLLRTRLATRS